jgi:hypothetical protein
MKSLFCALACSLALAACAVAPTAPPLMHTETVAVTKEVPVPCVSEIPQPYQPLLNDNDLLTGSGSQVADKLWLDHKVRSDWDDALLAAVTACSKLPAQPAALK